MRYKNSLKTLLRSPAKTLVTFVLLVATSFAFVSRGVEYAATVRQINAAEAQYEAIGTVEKSLQGYYDWMTETLGAERLGKLDEEAYLDRTDRAIVPLDSEIVEEVLRSECVAASEMRLVSGGTHDEYWSLIEQPLSDLEGYNQWWDEGASKGTFGMYDVLFVSEHVETMRTYYTYQLMYQQLLNYPGTMPTGVRIDGNRETAQYININDFTNHTEKFMLNANNPEVEAYWEALANQAKDGDLMIFACVEKVSTMGRTLNSCVDYPIINLSHAQREYGESDIETIISDPGKYGAIRYAIPSEQFRKNYRSYPTANWVRNMFPLSYDDVMTIEEYYATVERNFHTSEVVYTSDMALIHKVHSQDMYASSGRLLTAEDSGDVCVIGADFAELNGLSVGDSITLDLCADTMVHSGKVFGRETPFPTDRDVVSENQLTDRNLENVTKTFEIVGVWSDSDFDVEDPFTYAMNTIFVPDDCYPWAGQVEPSALPSTFSFRLKDPGDVAAMEDELGEELAALGYELSINDGGYAAAKPNLDFMKLTALIGFIGMCLALLLALILITYLFIIRKKKDYAIMRALGTTRGRSNRSLLAALLAMSVVAIAIGAILAGVVAQGSTARMAAEVAEITGEVTAADSSWVLTAAFAAGTLLLVWLFARVGLARISRTPPLELLQGR